MFKHLWDSITSQKSSSAREGAHRPPCSKFHICVTSRPEVDIRDVLEPLTPRQVSLHDQSGQKEDIENYVRSVVYSDLEPIMRRWRKEDKELVIETLSNQADGM